MSQKRKFSLACNKEGYLVLTWFIVRICVAYEQIIGSGFLGNLSQGKVPRR